MGDPVTTHLRTWQRVGVTLWIATIQFPILEAVVQSAWDLPYDRNSFYISDLGALSCFTSGDGRQVCSPWHALMNSSFVLQGLLIVGGVALLRRIFGRTRSALAGLAMLAIGGVGVALVGLAPEDTVGGLHYAGAALNFVGCNAGLVLLAAALRHRSRMTGPAVWAGTVGAIGLLALAFFVAEVYLGLGIGGLERVIAYTVPAALPVLAVALLSSGKSGRASSTGRPSP